jgi:hypothetical protein
MKHGGSCVMMEEKWHSAVDSPGFAGRWSECETLLTFPGDDGYLGSEYEVVSKLNEVLVKMTEADGT